MDTQVRSLSLCSAGMISAVGGDSAMCAAAVNAGITGQKESGYFNKRNNKNFYIMLATSEWAGPSPVVMAGPDVTLHNGVYIDEPVDPYTILLKVDDRANDPLDFAPKDIMEPKKALLFSKRFIELLNGAGVDNVQYIDADVTYEPTATKIPCKAANVIGVVSGLDMDKSEVIFTRKGNVLAIDKMCLDEDKLLGHKIARLQEDRMLIVVHKSIKEAVENAGLTGFMFVSDEQYEPGMI